MNGDEDDTTHARKIFLDAGQKLRLVTRLVVCGDVSFL